MIYQEIGTDVLPIELEKIGVRLHGRMRQAPLRLLDPLGNVDPLAKALGLDPREILSQPTPRPAYTGAAHPLVRIVNPVTVDKTNPAAKELLGVLKAAGGRRLLYLCVRCKSAADSLRTVLQPYNRTLGRCGHRNGNCPYLAPPRTVLRVFPPSPTSKQLQSRS